MGKIYKTYTENDKKKVVEAALDGEDWEGMAKALEGNLSTARVWISKAQKNGNMILPDKRREGNKKNSIITSTIIDAMINLVEADAQVTLKQISEMIEEKFEIKISTSSVARKLEEKSFSLKKLYHYSTTMNSDSNRTKRKIYVQKVSQFISEGKHIVYVDESNVNLFLRRSRARSKKGTRALGLLPASKGSNVHLIAGISLLGLHHFQRKRGAYKLQDAEEWVHGLLAEVIQSGVPVGRIVIVIDNAPVHSRLEEVVSQHPGVELLRLGLYSPFLNPIEHIWNVFKADIKTELPRVLKRFPYCVGLGLTRQEHRLKLLEETINKCKRSITRDKIYNAIVHVSNSYFGRCERMGAIVPDS